MKSAPGEHALPGGVSISAKRRQELANLALSTLQNYGDQIRKLINQLTTNESASVMVGKWVVQFANGEGTESDYLAASIRLILKQLFPNLELSDEVIELPRQRIDDWGNLIPVDYGYPISVINIGTLKIYSNHVAVGKIEFSLGLRTIWHDFGDGNTVRAYRCQLLAEKIIT